MRFIFLIYTGSSVNEKSRRTLEVLRGFTNKTYSMLDYRRLLDVLNANTVSLTGYRYFKITRGIILTVSSYALIVIID
jgi:hypothetical protein